MKDQLTEQLKNTQIITPSNDALTEVAAPKKPIRDSLGRSYGTGRRKNSVARVWVKPGTGKIIVNGLEFDNYFKRAVLRMLIIQVFDITNSKNQFDIFCTVKGGGSSGQAGAVKHGLSRALDAYDPESYHTLLRKNGFLTRDSRVVERKKYGQPKARKKFQFSKR